MGTAGSKKANNGKRGSSLRGGSNTNSSNAAKNCVTLGLYPSCSWEPGTLRKFIVEKKLAPIFEGTSEMKTDLEECPICFLYYPGGLNRSNCCKKRLCTECYLQVKKLPTSVASCPFCNAEPYSVSYVGPKTKEEKEIEEREQQLVLEAEERMRQEERERDEKRALERKQQEEERLNRANSNIEEINKDEEKIEKKVDILYEDYDDMYNHDDDDDDDDDHNNQPGSDYLRNIAVQLENNNLNPDELPEDIDDILLQEVLKLSVNDK